MGWPRPLLAALLLATAPLIGCLGGPTDEPPASGSDVETTDSAGPSGEDGPSENGSPQAPPTPGSEPSGPADPERPPGLYNVSATPSHGSVQVNYTLIGTDQSRIEVTAAHGDASRTIEAPPESGNRSVTVGFLAPDTSYEIRVDARGPNQTQTWTQTVTVTTDPSPYAWAGKQAPIRPGSEMTSIGTLGFVLRNATNETLYMLTAGHAVEHGEMIKVWAEDGEYRSGEVKVGPVVDRRYEEGHDWALVEIVDQARERVDPRVRHWAGPTKVASNATVEFNDTVCHYGHGGAYSLSEETRHRCGRLDGFNQSYNFVFWGEHSGGDSGSPVVHYDTGAAIGLLEGAFPPGPWGLGGGVTVCHLLDDVHRAGYDVALVTPAWDPPPADPAPPMPAGFPGGQGYPPPPMNEEPDDGPCPHAVKPLR